MSSGLVNATEPCVGRDQHPETWTVVLIGRQRLARPDQCLLQIAAHQLGVGVESTVA